METNGRFQAISARTMAFRQTRSEGIIDRRFVEVIVAEGSHAVGLGHPVYPGIFIGRIEVTTIGANPPEAMRNPHRIIVAATARAR